MRRSLVILLLLTLAALSSRLSPAKESGKRLLIVAPERFHSSLVEFVRHKEKQLPTELVSLERVLRENRGVDDPERLKRYLYRAWRHRAASYALLVGDA